MPKEKVLLISIALDGYSDLFRECLDSQKKYALRNEYDYVEIRKSPKKLLPAESAWLKLFILREMLNCDYDWIGFLDADCEVRPHCPDFKSSIHKSNKSIFMCHGFSNRINSGVIFLKNTPESFSYLNQVIENSEIEVPEEDKAIYENGHMIHFGKNNPDIEILMSSEWNNNQTFDKNSFIQHYSGGKLREDYLKANPLKQKKYFLRKRFKQIKKRFQSNKEDPLLDNLNKLIPELKNIYPKLNCGSIQNTIQNFS